MSEEQKQSKYPSELIDLPSEGKLYPKDSPLPLNENDIWKGKPVGATGPYGMAKRLLHEACETSTKTNYRRM